jgi:hypothetical protein
MHSRVPPEAFYRPPPLLACKQQLSRAGPIGAVTTSSIGTCYRSVLTAGLRKPAEPTTS